MTAGKLDPGSAQQAPAGGLAVAAPVRGLCCRGITLAGRRDITRMQAHIASDHHMFLGAA